MANNPELLKMPLARDGQKSTIPETTDASTGLFSQQYGWQSINSLPPQAGGKAVKREDFNGAFNLLGGIAYYAQKGFTFKWSSEQDYYAGCVVIDDTDGLRYECIADVTANNTAPSADATHWQIFKAGTDIDAWFRQASTVYAVGDMRCYESLPYGWYLDCTTAGTTGSSDITIPSPLNVGDTVTDGAVTWTIRKISSSDGVPLGAILPLAHNSTIPAGYLLCDGSAVSRTMYPDLYDAIGTTYGAGDGSTTFNLPDYNAAKRFAQGSTVAGVVKQAGLPNITGSIAQVRLDSTAAESGAIYQTNKTTVSYRGTNNAGTSDLNFDASRSSAIYGNSDTVQPPSLTCRYIIKAFDGMTPDSALIDITQYAQELAGKANITGSNMVHHRDVITTSGTYTAPITGLYKITVKGGGGGGGGGYHTSTTAFGGAGGGEGGTTIGFVMMTIGNSATVVVGAGGTGGAASGNGVDGGSSTVTIDSTTLTAGGGEGGYTGSQHYSGSNGGNGDIVGAPGQNGSSAYTAQIGGGAGGGNGGAGGYNGNDIGVNGVNGGGGSGGGAIYGTGSVYAGGAGGDGYVWFEYYTPGA